MAMSFKSTGDPIPLGAAVSKLMALRGYGRTRGGQQLHVMWRESAGEQISSRTKVLGVSNGVLKIGVGNAALLGELVSFHRDSLLTAVRKHEFGADIRELKFRLHESPQRDA